MPGPGKKRKSKAKAKDVRSTSKQLEPTPECLTLEEDEITRCGRPATEGYPKPDRCKVHHGQYRTMYKKYKDASEDVDRIKNGAELPTKEQIGRFKDWKMTLDKARWVRKYLEAIRVEKAGREIHQKRFFLKVDDGHRRRLKLLEKRMVEAVGMLDALQGRAYQLYKLTGALDAMNTQALPEAEAAFGKQSKQTTEELLEFVRNPETFPGSIPRILSKKSLPAPTSPGTGDEDLLDMSLRDQKEKMVMLLKPFIDFESFIETSSEEGAHLPETEYGKSMLEKQFFIYQQFARRIILHEPTLFMKSLGKVSLKDLILSEDFSIEDLGRFFYLFLETMGFPLMWFKDAVMDALAISRHRTAANVGSVGNRFSLLGGWVFNRSHTVSMSNEAWWWLIMTLKPPGNVENRFVRLCNNFDDLIGFLSFGAFGYVPSPNFCITPAYFEFEDPALSRNHLSLSGVIIADMLTAPHVPGPLPTTRRAVKRDCVVWAEMETRNHMFGAVRNERDGFVEAFLRELRARPDLFQVVLRSETAPGREVEMFGSGPSNNEALPVMRVRHFEAPLLPFPPSSPPSTSGKWEVVWSAVDVLYGNGERKEFPLQGHLTKLARNPKGCFFRFKKFPVRYFVIMDTVPHRDLSVLARNVSWAALRAGGYAEGEYTLRKYAVASDKLFERCAQDRLGWMPINSEIGWKMTRMEDQVNSSGVP